MDDSYAISDSKEDLEIVLGLVRELCERRGIAINERKTQIVKLSRGFTFLKKKVSITETGRVVMRQSRKTITSHRRKMKKLAKFYEAGELTRQQANQPHQSWRGAMLRINGRKSVDAMDALVKMLFSETPPKNDFETPEVI